MRYWPRRVSPWDGYATAPSGSRGGPDPINPLRAMRLRARGLTYREIGAQIAREDGRRMPYLDISVYKALAQYVRGERDEDGERCDRQPAVSRRVCKKITLARVGG